MSDYDIIVVGGGLGGAALARSMAEDSARVLVLERETEFKDRVRGEAMMSWGNAEVRNLGCYDALKSAGAHEPNIWELRMGPMVIAERPLSETTPSGTPAMTFYHPQAQEALLSAAAAAGAEVRRGTRVTGVTAGAEPSVEFGANGAKTTATARLVIGADGRSSMVRTWAGFASQEDPDELLLAGLLFDSMPAPDDRATLTFNPGSQMLALIFPQGNGRARGYFGCRSDSGIRLQGDRDIPRFVEACIQVGMPGEYYEGAKAAGPLATFPGAESWVEHPYKDGVVLLGDAAAQSDQTWGQGMALAFRDARTLRDALRSESDWDKAGHVYAAAHDSYFSVTHTVEGWFTRLFMGAGPEADSIRARVFPLVAQEPGRTHDAFVSGPECAPADEAARRFFFAED